MEPPIYYSPLILEVSFNSKVPMFPQPYPSGGTYPLGGIYPLAQPYSRRHLSCLLYHTTSLGASSYSYHSTFTQPSHTTTQGLQLSLEWIGRRYPTPTHATSQPHSSMLSLPYPYGMPMVYPYPMPIPMVVPQPCTATTHTPHTEPQRDHSQPRAWQVGTTTGTARHRGHQRANHNGRHRPRDGATFKILRGAGDQQPLTFFGFA